MLTKEEIQIRSIIEDTLSEYFSVPVEVWTGGDPNKIAGCYDEDSPRETIGRSPFSGTFRVTTPLRDILIKGVYEIELKPSGGSEEEIIIEVPLF